MTILDMNERYQRLKFCLDEWACDAMVVLSGEAILYDDFPPTEDAIFSSLIASSEYDATHRKFCKHCLVHFLYL